MKKKKCSFTETLHRGHKSIVTMAKLHELLPCSPYSQNLTPTDFWLFADLKRMLHGKRFDSKEQVISETEAYFETKDKSFYKKKASNCKKSVGISLSLKKETMLTNKVEFCLKFVLLVRPGTY